MSGIQTGNVPLRFLEDSCLPGGRRMLSYRIDLTQIPVTQWTTQAPAPQPIVATPAWSQSNQWTMPYQLFNFALGSNTIPPLNALKTLMFVYRPFYGALAGDNVQDDEVSGLVAMQYLEQAIVSNVATQQSLYLAPENVSIFNVAGTGNYYPNRIVVQGAIPFFGMGDDEIQIYKQLAIVNTVPLAIGMLTLHFANFEISPWHKTSFAAFLND